MLMRKLGKSGIEVSALGMGCWAIGGPFTRDGKPVGWGEVDDAESVRSIRQALDAGITLFDTADVYGCGHSERLLGKTLRGIRSQVVLATKFGNIFDETKKAITGASGEPDYIRQACDASLQRLQTDYIDLYQLHLGNYELEKVPDMLQTLEDLVALGKIRAYGWSTDSPERIRAFARGEHCAGAQVALNILEPNLEKLRTCEELGLACLNRGPLAKGLLTGKFTADSVLPENDVRHSWNFKEGDIAGQMRTLDSLRSVLTARGHSLPQAALAWLWAKSPATIPIPGFRNVQQVQENTGAAAKGPLTIEQMEQIEGILGMSR